MEIYILNRQHQIEEIVEHVETFIWTERYSAYGDFELVVPSDSVTRSLYSPGVYIIQSLSNRVMIVKSVENTMNDEGKKTLTIKGWSLESLLLDKIGRSSATSYPYLWRTNRTPTSFIRTAVKEIVIDGVRSTKDIIPNLAINQTPVPGAMAEPGDSYLFEFEPKPLYEIIKTIADAYDLGLRIVRNPTTGGWTFETYMGFDRRASQSVNAAVLFSSSLDNLQNTSLLKSDVDFKNVALVYSEQGLLEVHASGVSTSVSGMNRRVLLVKADTLSGSPTTPEITAHLTKTGREALAAHRMTEAFDGEVSQYSPYLYGRDYGLGDLVEFQNDDGGSSNMMVTEQIWSLDAQGLRAYPTLTLHTYVQPGSWLSWDANKEWDDLTTEVWNTMP